MIPNIVLKCFDMQDLDGKVRIAYLVIQEYKIGLNFMSEVEAWIKNRVRNHNKYAKYMSDFREIINKEVTK